MDPARGPTTETIYEGTFDAVLAAEATLTNVAYDADYSNPPVARLTIYSPDYGDTNDDPNSIILTTFDLLANTSQRSGYEHRKSLAISASSPETIRVIKTAIRKNTAPSVALTDNSLKLYNHMLNGQDQFVDSQFVFKLTQYISRRAVIGIAYSGVNKIYTSASLIAETNPTGIYAAAIGFAFEAVRDSVYGGIDNVPAGFTLGWLKQAPTITTVADNKSAVSIEYWLEAWSQYYYA